jgi:hypothetical protein
MNIKHRIAAKYYAIINYFRSNVVAEVNPDESVDVDFEEKIRIREPPAKSKPIPIPYKYKRAK